MSTVTGIITILIIILVILAIGAIIGFVFLLINLGKDPLGLCIGYMKDDGLCCDTVFAKADFDKVREFAAIENVPYDFSDKTNGLLFMLGLYQSLVDKHNITFFENQYTFSKLLITYAKMYIGPSSTNPDVTTKNVYVVITNIHDYNKIRADTLNGATVPTVDDFPTGFKSFQYLKDMYNNIKTAFAPNYPSNVVNLYVVTVEDSGPLGYQFRQDFAAQGNIHYDFGQVRTYDTTIPVDDNMHTIDSDHDKYSSLYPDNFKGAGNYATPPADPNYLCVMDYHRTPYWNQYRIFDQ